MRRSNKRNDLDHLRRVIRQYGVSEIVMGLPLRMSGSEGIQSEKVQAFAEELRRKFKLPVHLFDERLTSVEANRVLRETDMSIRRRAEVVDQLAAVLILQSFLEFRESRRKPSPRTDEHGFPCCGPPENESSVNSQTSDELVSGANRGEKSVRSVRSVVTLFVVSSVPASRFI